MLHVDLRRLNIEKAGANPARGTIIYQLFAYVPVLRPSDKIKRLK
jgi:hypothetical protein